VHRSIALVCSILLELQSFVLRRESDLKKRGKILKLCALIKVR
jgi:hypothetical protein